MSHTDLTETSNTILVSYQDMEKQFYELLIKYGFKYEQAIICAQTFAENSLDGVYTHGVNRFPRFIQNIKEGHIIINNEPVLTGSFGAVNNGTDSLVPEF